jgi:hypothetical protein
MSEWPITIHRCPVCKATDHIRPFTPKMLAGKTPHYSQGEKCPGNIESVDLIPADLGRELYEALKETHPTVWAVTSNDEFKYAPHPALARYEREVGE